MDNRLSSEGFVANWRVRISDSVDAVVPCKSQERGDGSFGCSERGDDLKSLPEMRWKASESGA